jgi:hypothetical protein
MFGTVFGSEECILLTFINLFFMKIFRKQWLAILSLSLLFVVSSCYVRVENGHRHWYRHRPAPGPAVIVRP